MSPSIQTRASVAERPELASQIEALIASVWPTYFLYAHPYPNDGMIDWGGIYRRWPQLQLALFEDRTLIAAANSIPLAWDDAPEALPNDGWDWAMRQGREDLEAGRTPKTLCGLSVTIARDRQGEGLSSLMLRWMHAVGREHGMERLIVPVRPAHKARYPHTPMAEYANWTNSDGLPQDPWIRTHIRIGGRIVKPCNAAMRMSGTVAEWSEWLGNPIPASGFYIAPDLLTPLVIDSQTGIGLYTEPNLWIIHGEDNSHPSP